MPRTWVVSFVIILICSTVSLSGIYFRIFIIYIVRPQLFDVIPSKIYLNINNALYMSQYILVSRLTYNIFYVVTSECYVQGFICERHGQLDKVGRTQKKGFV